MKIETSHNCCGHRAISGLNDIDLKTGKVHKDDYWGATRWRTGGKVALSTLIRDHHWHDKPCQAFSWIANERQGPQSAVLKLEFEKLKFTVQTVRLNTNPKSGNKMHMRIAIRSPR